MSEIIGVRFKEGGKVYYFRPNEEELKSGCHVVVETVRGIECGEVVMERREIDDREFNREVKTIIRKATDADLAKLKENKIKAKKAFDICNQKIKAHGLEMNLLEVECTFDNSKMVFNFSAEGRVDFRELVKDLASVFHARIELRQIGVRDEAKMLGGLGVCGRPFCCKQFMGDFQSVSIKMAKEQGLSLNPVKISGTCGRLMCCLKHEQDAYEDLMRMLPQVGSQVVTPDGNGVVVDRELIAGRVKVRLDGFSEAPPKVFRAVDVHKPGEAPATPPHAADKRENDGVPGGRKKSPQGVTESASGRKKPVQDIAESTSGRKKPAQDIAESTSGRKKPAQDIAESTSGRKKPAQDFTESTSGRKKPAQDFTESTSGKKKPPQEAVEAAPGKKKPVIDYSAIDFEESISGRVTKVDPDEYEDDTRNLRVSNKNRDNSHRPGRRPDRRNQSRKGNNGGKPNEGEPTGENAQGAKSHPKPYHGKGRPHGSKKPGGKGAGDNAGNSHSEPSDK